MLNTDFQIFEGSDEAVGPTWSKAPPTPTRALL